MRYIKSRKCGRLFSLLMAVAMVLTSVPVAWLIHGDEAYAAADTINVTLKQGKTLMSYGGTGLSYQYTVNVNGTDRAAFCLQPSEVAPDVGTRKAAAMPDSNKVSKTMYYCYGYPGQRKLQSWLNSNGYGAYSSGSAFYTLSHVILSYAYEPSGAFVGWSNGYANTTISSSYQTMVKNAYGYVQTLDDPAGFTVGISFAGSGGSVSDTEWTEDGEFRSKEITFKAHEDNYVTYTVPADLTLHMNGIAYAGGSSVTIEGGDRFYLTTTSVERANSTYTSPTLTGALQDYTAYKITDSGSQNMAFFAVDKAGTASFSVKFGNVNIELTTLAQDSNTKSQQGTATPGATFTDTVSYANVTLGKSYTIKGTLVDKETGNAIMAGGAAVTAEKTFTAEKSTGTVVLEYQFDASLIKGKTTVVFEELYDGDKNLASHADLRDEGQTIYFPDLKTAARDLKTEVNQGITERDDVLIDEVSYSNVIPGKEYTVKGILMDKETGNPILVGGKEVTSETTFKAEKTSGSIRMKFILDARALKGKTVVVFEDLYQGEVKVVAHADLEDEGQSVKYPAIKTTAKDEATGDNVGAIRKETKLIDTVSYSNLIAGKEYTLKGKLMDQATGKPYKIGGKEVTSETTFTPEKENGTVDVTFVFDSTGMEGKSVVVFERLVMDGVKVTAHADINDLGQTIHFPLIWTKAKDGVTNTNKGSLEKTATIIDTVTYTNLIPGKEYTIKGKLMDKSTEKPLKIDGKEVTSETTFTPEKTSGTVEMKFSFDSRSLEGKTVVVFEDLYCNDIKVGGHADIHDEGQSIEYPPATPPDTPQTGDASNVILWILIGGAAALLTIGLAWKRKK